MAVSGGRLGFVFGVRAFLGGRGFLRSPRPCRRVSAALSLTLGSPLGSPRCGGLRRKTVTSIFFAAAVCKITHKEAKVRGGAVPWR